MASALEELLKGYGTAGSALAQALAQSPSTLTGAATPAPTQTQDPAAILASAGLGAQADDQQASQTPTPLAGAVDWQDAVKAYMARSGAKRDPLAAAKGARTLGTDINLSGNERSGANYQTIRVPGRGTYHVYYDTNGKRRALRVGAAPRT